MIIKPCNTTSYPTDRSIGEDLPAHLSPHLFAKAVGEIIPSSQTKPIAQRKITSLGPCTEETGPAAYQELTKRIAKKKASPGCMTQAQLLEKINQVNKNHPDRYAKFLDEVKAGNLNQIHSIKNYPFYALKAVEQGSINRTDFATIMMYWSSQTAWKPCIKLFDEQGNPNPLARDLIQQTLPLSNGKLFLSEKELNEFFTVMKNAPPLQRQFFLEDPQIRLEGEKLSVRDRIADENVYGMNVFSKCTYNSQNKVMIPSAEMMQSFLHVKFEKNAIKMNFVLGLSTAGQIRENGLSQTRDVALRFPEIYAPNEADGFLAKGTDFTYHDFFHSTIASCAPHEDQKKLIAIADAINSTITSEERKHPSIEIRNKIKWYELFVDMEVTQYYATKFREITGNMFFNQVSFSIIRAQDLHYLCPKIQQKILNTIKENVFNNECDQTQIRDKIEQLEKELTLKKQEIEVLREECKALITKLKECRCPGCVTLDLGCVFEAEYEEYHRQLGEKQKLITQRDFIKGMIRILTDLTTSLSA